MPLLEEGRSLGDLASTRFRAARVVLMTLTISLCAVAQAAAQTPVASPTYALQCSDCTGTEYFGELEGADTADCQDYELNTFENWTAEGEASPDPKFIAAAQ